MKKIILLLTICLLFLAGISYAQIGYDGKRVTPRSPVGDIMHYPAAGFAISTGYAWDTTIPKGTMTSGKYCTYDTETGISCASNVVTISSSDTLTNKTLTAPVINGATGTGGKFTGDLTGLSPVVIVAGASGLADGSSTSDNICHHSSDSAATNSYVGMTIYNTTNSTSCTVTANDDVSITCAAGSTMSWDGEDAYRLGPGPSQSGSFFYVAAAGTLQWPTTAGYSGCAMAEGTAALKIDFGASVVFTGVLNTAVESTTAGDYIAASGTTTDDFMCLHNKTTTVAKGLGKRGTWTQE